MERVQKQSTDGINDRGFNAATEGNSVESWQKLQPIAVELEASMRPRRGTPWKGRRNRHVHSGQAVLQCGHGGELRGKLGLRRTISAEHFVASMRPRRGTPWKASDRHASVAGGFASMRPRRGTPWKGQAPPSLAGPIPGASMRPRRGTPWKDPNASLEETLARSFNAATEGNSVESG